MKPSDRIQALAEEHYTRELRAALAHDRAPAEGILRLRAHSRAVEDYLDEQRGLIVITAPEHASEQQLAKIAEGLQHLTERHDIVILPLDSRVVSGAPELVRKYELNPNETEE